MLPKLVLIILNFLASGNKYDLIRSHVSYILYNVFHYSKILVENPHICDEHDMSLSFLNGTLGLHSFK